jgi:hypothetical protein
MLTGGEIGAWLDEDGWRVVCESGDRVIAEKRILGTPHDWQVLFLRQLDGMPWTARMTQRTPLVGTDRVYAWGVSHSSPDLHTLEDVGLWIGGMESSFDPHHQPPQAA